jgi:GR25 family glycosyltransferase involved in LPS biosynthesis
MKAFVITVKDIPESVQCAERCIKSAAEHGLDVEMFFGVTPKDNPLKMLDDLGISPKNFTGKYSRVENCVAAFLSHRALWERCSDLNEDLLVFEHDAVVVAPIPVFKPYNRLISYGKPSYGNFRTPMKIGVNPLTSKAYLPGAHAYALKPSAARILLEESILYAGPTDVFLSKSHFPWIEEYYPWPVEVNDTFSTIQKNEGCLAKHNYGEGYKII